MFTSTCERMGSGVWVEGLAWERRRDDFPRAKRRNKERCRCSCRFVVGC